eukprot:2745927-Rhodomonas_salina.1
MQPSRMDFRNGNFSLHPCQPTAECAARYSDQLKSLQNRIQQIVHSTREASDSLCTVKPLQPCRLHQTLLEIIVARISRTFN